MSKTAPIINANGTNREVLVTERLDAVRSLRAASEALSRITVNGRDYVGDSERLAAALGAHEDRLLSIRRMIRELTDECVALRSADR